MEGVTGSVTTKSDFTDVANVFANALLDGKKLVVDAKGTLRLGTNEVTPYSQEELDKVTVAIIATILNRRDGASTPVFDKSQFKRISEFYIQEANELVSVLANPAEDGDAVAAQHESIFRALEGLNGRPTYENSNQLNISQAQAKIYLEQHLENESVEFPYKVIEFLGAHKAALERDRERILSKKLNFTDKPDNRSTEAYLEAVIFHINHIIEQHHEQLRQETLQEQEASPRTTEV